jgi:hypothetical protein
MVFLFLAFCLPTAEAAPPQPDCKKVEQLYQQQLKDLDRSCTRKSDCKLDVLDWTACGTPISHRDREIAKSLVEARTSLHATCHYVVGPCAAQIAEAFCQAGTCTTGEELRKSKLVIRFKLILNGSPWANRKITIDYDNGIRCGTAPCPSRTLLATLQTDGNGEFTLPLSRLFSIYSDQRRFRLNASEHLTSEFALDELLPRKEDPIRHEVRWEK